MAATATQTTQCTWPQGCPMVVEHPSGRCKRHRPRRGARRAPVFANENRKRGPLQTTRWRKLRLVVLERAGWRCQECGARLRRHAGQLGRPAHVDHIRPLSRGGAPFDLRNLRALCSGCNLGKGDR